MADRTYNDIEWSIYDQDWSDPAILIAAMLLAHIPNEHGVFDPPIGKIRKFFRNIFEAHDINKALNELENVGLLRWYNEKKTVWVIKKFKRSKWHKTPNNQLGALLSINKHHPAALLDFANVYELSGYLVPTESVPSGYLVTTKQQPSANPVPTESVPCRTPDTDTDIKKNITNSAKKPKSTKIKAKDIVTPTLAELEEKVPADAFDEWIQFKTMCCASNRSGEMADTKLANLLNPILSKSEKEKLSGEALAHGFMAAVNAKDGDGAPNSNYVLKAARGYRPPRGLSNSSPSAGKSIEMPASFKAPEGKT